MINAGSDTEPLQFLRATLQLDAIFALHRYGNLQCAQSQITDFIWTCLNQVNSCVRFLETQNTAPSVGSDAFATLLVWFGDFGHELHLK
jgi:hypothetical protein